MTHYYVLLACAALLSRAALAQSPAAETMLLREPALSRNKLAFSYAGDIWTANRDGSNPQRLTVGPGVETSPHFSPDGQWIAYTGDYDRNSDVYVVAVSGGQPRRLTWHPSVETVRDWTPDGQRILFSSSQEAYARSLQLFTVATAGGLPTRLPLLMGEKGSYSADGKQLAHTHITNATSTWKHYRGGQTGPIWLTNLQTLTTEEIPHENATDTSPLWLGGKVYFLSDRQRTNNVFVYDVATKQVAQLTRHTDYDVKALSGYADELVYEQAGRLHLFNTTSGKTTDLSIRITPEVLALRPQYRNVAPMVRTAAISPTGMRAVVEARGDIFTVPAKKGESRNLTHSDASHERYPAWSPDGTRIAYLSDASGEYQLLVQDQRGTTPAQAYSLGKPSFYYHPLWSPDSKKIAYTDKNLNLWYLNLATKKPVRVATDAFGPLLDDAVMAPAWSPDAQWLAYSVLMPNHLRSVYVYHLPSGRRFAVSDGRSDATAPAFSRDGKHLFFSASTDVGLRTTWLDMTSYDRTSKRTLYVAVLNKQDPSPFAPQSDEEKDAVLKPDSVVVGKPVGNRAAPKVALKDLKPKKPDAIKVSIDTVGLRQRILVVPGSAVGDLSDVQAADGDKVFYLESTPATAPAGPTATTPEPAQRLHRFDLKERKDEVFMAEVKGYALSADGKKILYMGPGNAYGIVEAAGKPTATDGKLALTGLDSYIDPRHEWEQMFNEVWRLERDYFYDANMHGLDWAATKKKYASFLPHVAHRADLNYLFAEMMGEMVVGHNYVSGGDMPAMQAGPVGLLGADYEIANDHYRFKRVFNGESFNPGLRAPLTGPGVNVRAGDYLLAVNNRPLRPTDNVYSFFENTVGKQITLTVNDQPTLRGAREVTVVPVANEATLRRIAWVESNRRKVDELTGGRVAYVYLPNTSAEGYEFFNRYYFSQLDKEAVIVDERFNGGGFVADYILDLLNRPLLSYWAPREGRAFTSPGASIYGPKVMLVNEFAGSGGDALPAFFRRRGLGTIVGKRTWGGLVGISGYPVLMDGGSVTSPSFAIYSPEGKWEIENEGVAPDIEVDVLPSATQNGDDPQLAKAVEVIMADLKKQSFKPLLIPVQHPERAKP
ncbi:S41 family peptidase [Hymenobacter mucosus]|uniref:Tricorn protease homolog n=1 Tax=Hymenobacter mucosus TaxID=1411120 RepID=A0A238ZE67_9BACT|nr:S41 family peptidase [Hymenobacter mucosus]SNR81231.1 tricorn protease [Hymenobacter mucosus]